MDMSDGGRTGILTLYREANLAENETVCVLGFRTEEARRRYAMKGLGVEEFSIRGNAQTYIRRRCDGKVVDMPDGA